MKRLKRWIPFILFLFVLGLSGCSSNSKSELGKMNDEKAKMDSAKAGNSYGDSKDLAKTSDSVGYSKESDKKENTTSGKIEVPNQMIIYQADLRLRVKKFEKTVQILEEKVAKYSGYIADSNVTNEGNGQLSGTLKIRIPQKYFQQFLHDAEGEATEVIQRNITGQDVTEEYVDLESRLKSKRVVEERLITFMKSATKTEDLLKISSDLASVQEEIETIEGKMKFLENQTALSTINMTLYENKVIVPNLEKDKLNTWDRTKKQFMESTNFLLSALSAIVVFFIGNLPILLILSIIGLLVFLSIKKVKKGNSKE